MFDLPYWKDNRALIGEYRGWNREERHMAATLYALMITDRAGLRDFLTGPCEVPCTQAECDIADIWFEFSFLRDWWARLDDDRFEKEAKRGFLCDLLGRVALETSSPDQREVEDCVARLRTMALEDFNRLFSSRPSKNMAESPARWSIDRIVQSYGLACPGLARRAVLLAWFFRIKPDIVVRIRAEDLVVVEAKWDSKQSRYTCDLPGMAFNQVRLQRYMFRSALGFSEASVHSIVLEKTKSRKKHEPKTTSVCWAKAFECFRVPSSPSAKSVLPPAALGL